MTQNFNDFDIANFFKAAKGSEAEVNKRTRALRNRGRHMLLHTRSPDATLHHAVITEIEHPKRDKRSYYVCYVSIPLEWEPLITREFIDRANLSFFGPPGMTQRVPPALTGMGDVLNTKLYIGLDWLDESDQPSPVLIAELMQATINELRNQYDGVDA